jgi:hypothetical protein
MAKLWGKAGPRHAESGARDVFKPDGQQIIWE